MALVSGEQEYSSPAKRLKLDQTQHLSNSNVELDFGTLSAPIKNVHGVIKGQYAVTAEVLSNTDSGYNETSCAPCSDEDGKFSSSGLQPSAISNYGIENSNIWNGLNKSEEDDREDDKDEVSSTVSNLSNFSGLSGLSDQKCKPMAGSGYNKTSASCSVISGQSSSSGLRNTSLSQDKGNSDLCEGQSKDEEGDEDEDDEEDEDEDDEEDEEDDDKDEVSSTVSNLSNLSGLSDLSGQDWKPMAGPMSWVQKQMLTGVNPRSILCQLMGDHSHIPHAMDDLTLWKIIVNMLSEPPRRPKLKHINTLQDVVDLLKVSKKIIVLTGAGVSVSCGIPDFRSRDGIYSRLALDFPDLPDPQAMFDIQYFSQDPRPFFKFAREIYPGQFKPSPCHRFIKMLEDHNKLLRNYSQNIDTLEQVAGIKNVIECHGSFATASCTRCKYKVTADAIREDIFAQKIPLCPKCSNNAGPHVIDNERYSEDYKELVQQGIMKPDIVFFGEGLPVLFHESMVKDKDECDLLIVIGSSLKVRPVALIPSSIPAHVPQILINREPLPSFNFDVKLLGDSDIIINQLCHLLGDDWSENCWCPQSLVEAKQLSPAMCSRRSSCDDTWSNLYDKTDSTASNCENSSSIYDHGSVAKLNIEPPGQSAENEDVGRENMMEGSCSPFPGDQGSNVEGSEADSFQMSIDSGMGLSADSTCSGVKERHMSVDSSTRDSGICFSADSPVESLNRNFTIVGSSQDLQDNADIQCEIRCMPCGVSGNTNQSNKNTDKGSSVVCSLKQLPADSTSHGRQYTVLIDSSSLLSEQNHTNESSSPRVDEETQSVSMDSSYVGPEKDLVSSSMEQSCASVKNRQTSVDSTRDSGIGDGTSSVDSSASCSASTSRTKECHMLIDSDDETPDCEDDIEALRACWQPKIRESLASRLPDNSYYFMHPSTYIFPGAEVFCKKEK